MNNIIIFDLDNTFYNYKDSHNAAIKKVYKSQNIYTNFKDFEIAYKKNKSLVQNLLKQNPSRHSKLIYFKKLFFQELSLEEIIELEAVYWREFISSTEIDVETIELLRHYHKKGWLYFLFTNQNINIQIKKIISWELNFFDFILTSEEAGYEKPDHKFFKLADDEVSKHIKKNSKIYAVGDDYLNDIKFWEDKYGAKSFLIDNSKNIPNNKDDLTITNFQHAVSNIFK
tara:strand:- start:36 stop:719 length:684 start_codon:yes stop_codon:yes gene_type:complete